MSTQESPFELDLQFGQPPEQNFGIRLYIDDQHWTEIGFDRSKREFYMDRTKSGRAITADFLTKTIAPLAENRPYDLKVIVDRSSIEAYAQNGTIVMTNLVFPGSDKSRIVLFSQSGKPVAVTGDIWRLRTIWK
jgi:sucrose-6-phosphate hydrolase SacC (GH32 family)